MRISIDDNSVKVIPSSSLGAPFCDYDGMPTRCYFNVYDSIYAYDDTCNTRGITSSTSGTTTFHWEAGLTDNGGGFSCLAGGLEWEPAEFGMPCYGYRFYNPDLGRWVNRDPIGERGGLSLYCDVE